MESVEFTVRGSSATPYAVRFTYEENKLGAFCTCVAGSNGTACKHRLSILARSDAEIVSGGLDQRPEGIAWLNGSEIKACILELSTAEAVLEKAKTQVSIAKKKLSTAMIT